MKITKKHDCRICGVRLTLKNAYPSSLTSRWYRCKACQLAETRPFRIAYNRKLKADIIENYGGKCRCCGEKRLEFLTIDHKHGGGLAHRKELGGSGNKIYRLLKREGYPRKEYQLLRMNCNFAKGHYGKCPHKKEAK
jgi:hypothetical protein